MIEFRVTEALKRLLWSQIESRADLTVAEDATPGLSVYRKVRDAAGVAELDEVEANELREELEFWLDPDHEKYPGEARCARAALKRLAG